MRRDSRDPQPPRRLVEDREASATPSARWAVRLLEAALPYQSAPGRKQRVRLGLAHAETRAATKAGAKAGAKAQARSATKSAPVKRLLILRTAVVGAVLIGLATAASATLGYWPTWLGGPGPSAAPEAEAAPRAPSGAARAARVRTSAATSQPQQQPPPTETAPAPEQPEGPEAPPALPHTAPAAGRSPRPTAARPAEDTSPVVEAMRALRADHDPVRARALLARYLHQHPRGALAEEALAISIEAAVTHGDRDAADLAARYLQLYPAGHFLPLARQAAGARPDSPRP